VRRIIDVAREHGVPLEQNPELAEVLSALELDEEIPERLYRVAAQILGFILPASDICAEREAACPHPSA